MPLILNVDTPVWHAHLRAVVASDPGLVPVAKGNGYGFTVPVLTRTAAGLGVGRIAVGTARDAEVALGTFPGEVIVLDTHAGIQRPQADQGRRVLYTAGSVEAAAGLAGRRRLVVDCRTSLLRQGIVQADLPALRAVTSDGRDIEAFSVHLPLDRPPGSDPAAETGRWVRQLTAAGLGVRIMYVSHLEPAEIGALTAAFPGTEFRQRTGTRLWLGRRSALRGEATVLEVTPLRRGERFGYRQHRARRDGWLVTVAAGTAHGVGLVAPGTARGFGQRARTLALSGLATMNRVRSPFTWDGHRLWFAEPPHMLVSMLALPRHSQPPKPGMELGADLRYTTAHFDSISLRPCHCPVDGRSHGEAVPDWTTSGLTGARAGNFSADPLAELNAA